MGVGAIIGWVIFGLILLLMVWFFSMYNSLIHKKNNVEEAFSTMDVCMKKRYDLIPNYVETVKGYAKHENETLEQVISARNAAVSSTTPDDKIANDGTFTQALRGLLMVVEKYPDLKANQNFIDLQNTLSKIEEEIAYSRKYYNAVVKDLNNKIEMIPTNLVAKMMKLEKRKMYEIDSPEERKNVKVQF